MKTYEIKVYRDGKWWMVEIPEIDGLTQARRLSEVEDMARSFIAVDQDVAPSEIQLRNPQVIVSGEDLGSTMRDILEHRRAARVAEEKAAALMVATARKLAKQQVPLRDIGEVLGVSHQRVHQLVQEINATAAQAAKRVESFDAKTAAADRAAASAKRAARPALKKAAAAAAPARKAAAHSSRSAAVTAAKSAPARRPNPARKTG